MGYGIIKIGARSKEDLLEFRLQGPGSPLLRMQSWFQKTYCAQKVTSFWVENLDEGREVDSHNPDFAVNIIVDPRSISLRSLEISPWTRPVREAHYRRTKDVGMILCDGFSRLCNAQRIAHDIQTLQDDNIPNHFTWMARFYNKGTALVSSCSPSTHLPYQTKFTNIRGSMR